MTGEQLTLLLNTVVAAVLPLLVGLVTTRATSPAVRAVLLLVLSFVQTLIGQVLAAIPTGQFDWFTWLITGIGSFVVGVAVHFGLWKPSGTSDRLVGVGSN